MLKMLANSFFFPFTNVEKRLKCCLSFWNFVSSSHRILDFSQSDNWVLLTHLTEGCFKVLPCENYGSLCALGNFQCSRNQKSLKKQRPARKSDRLPWTKPPWTVWTKFSSVHNTGGKQASLNYGAGEDIYPGRPAKQMHGHRSRSNQRCYWKVKWYGFFILCFDHNKF